MNRVGAMMFGLAASALSCGKDSAAASAIALAATPPSSHIDGNNYKLDATASDCTVGAACVATIRLEALGGYHINASYPYKFKAQAAPGVEFLGQDASDRHVFSKASGDFSVTGEKVAAMVVRFRTSAKGKLTIAGTYKMSVCSDANCQLEQPGVAFDVEIK